MWKAAALAHPGEWLCFLGSALALVAFFLPYWSPPPGSLDDWLILLVARQPSAGGFVILLGTGALLLLLLGITVLAALALFLRLSRWNITKTFLRLTIATLIYYSITAPISYFFYWFSATISGTLPLALGIGVWLMPVGLILALIGGILLERRERKANG